MIGEGTIVLDLETDRQYILTGTPRFGAYTLAYESVSQDTNFQSETVVVKVGRVSEKDHSTPERLEKRISELRNRYKDEQELVANILSLSKDNFVPWIHNGKVANPETLEEWEKEIPILVTKLIGEDKLLLLHKVPNANQVIEKVAVHAGAQYCDLLYLLHHELKKTCQDRKDRDIRWEVPDKLYVLDWNVTRIISDLPEEAKEDIQKDIRLFGYLWFGFMVGTVPETYRSLPVDIQVTSENPWTALSRGSRQLLKMTLESSNEEGFFDAADAKAAWQAWADTLMEKPEIVLEKAEEFKRNSPGLNWEKNWNEVANRVDLLERRADQTDIERLQTLQIWVRDMPAIRQENFNRQIQTAVESLKNGLYAQAISLFLKLRSSSEWLNDQRLYASEWWITASLLKAWFDFSDDNFHLSKLSSNLFKMVEELQTKNLHLARKSWDVCMQLMENLIQGEPARYKSLLEAHLALYDALESANTQDVTQQKLAYFELAHRKLKEIIQLDDVHGKFILNSLNIPLASQIDQLQLRVRSQKLGVEAKQRENEVANRIQKQLDAAQGKLKWTPLNSLLELLPNSSLLKINLEEVDFAIENGINRLSLEKVILVADDLINLEYLQIGATLKTLILALAGKRVRDIYNQKLYWPSEVQTCLHLISAIKIVESTDNVIRELTEIEKELTDIQGIQKRYNELLRKNKKVYEDLENDEVDYLLQSAYDQKIQMNDRTYSKTHSKDISSVQDAIAARHSLRMKNFLDESTALLKTVSANQEEEIREYKLKEDELRKLKNEVASLVKGGSPKKDDNKSFKESLLHQTIYGVLVEWQENQLPEIVSKLDDRIEDVKRTIERTTELASIYMNEDQIIELYEIEIGQLEQRLANLPVRISGWGNGFRQAKEKYIDLERNCWQTLTHVEDHLYSLPFGVFALGGEHGQYFADYWEKLLRRLISCLQEAEKKLRAKTLPIGRDDEWNRYLNSRVMLLKMGIPVSIPQHSKIENRPA